MSRIDRFLITKEWCSAWPNCMQVAQLRCLSDHCPLILFVDEENWGPRPSWFLKCWSDTPGYKQFVTDKWKTLQVEGWGGYVLKEKFKLIKLALKEWHTSHAQNLSAKIASLKDRLAEFDGKEEVEELTDAECVELHGVSANIHSLSILNNSICWQQSRNQWLREGDANSKFFHSVMTSRRRHNTICSILVDGVRIEGVEPVRHAIFTHFARHFQLQNEVQPSMSNLHFRSLSMVEGGGLIKPFWWMNSRMLCGTVIVLKV